MTAIEPERGLNLELRTASYFQSLGFLVKRGVLLTLDGINEATDIDLLGLRYHLPLDEERIVADCKERSRSRPYERTLWTLGLGTMAKAKRCIIVQPRPNRSIRVFAAQGGIEVLGTDSLSSHLSEASSRFQPFGDANLKIASFVETARERSKDKWRTPYRAYARVRSMLVFGHPITNINRILKELTNWRHVDLIGSDHLSWLYRFVCYEAAVVFTVMLIRVASEYKWNTEKDWSDHVRTRLTYGDIDPVKAGELIKISMKVSPSNVPSPVYTEELVAILRSLITTPSLAKNLAFGMDFYLFGKNMLSFATTYTDPTLGAEQAQMLTLCQRVLSAISFATGLPAEIWTLGSEAGHVHTESTTGQLEFKDTGASHSPPSRV